MLITRHHGRALLVGWGDRSASSSILEGCAFGKLVRGDALEKGMSDYLVQAIRHLPNVEVRLNTEIASGHGERTLERLVLRDRVSGATETVDANVLFALIGASPHTEWLAGVVERDRLGFVRTGDDLECWPLDRAPARLETSMPGVFAAGDVRAGAAKRLASAVGEGTMSVQHAWDYLSPIG